MNIQEYISSGIIESYVLGLATKEEMAEFESLCRQHPELLKARLAFEESLEQSAMREGIQPPSGLKQVLLEQIGAPGRTSIPSKAPIRKMNGLRYAAAASFVLLAASLFWNISMLNKNKRLTHDLDNKIARLNDVEKDLRMIEQNPNVKMAVMKGMDASPQSFATVYWDTTSHDVFLLVNNLPSPATNKQYQLWALFNGSPISMGVFDMKDFRVRQRPLLYQMKNAQNAQGFAITLEKMGGSEKPEGDMYVMGNL